MSKIALITGVTGQDGSHLAHFLLNEGYCVIGLTRDDSFQNFQNLRRLGLVEKLIIKKCNLLNLSDIIKIFEEFSPDEVYNLASQSSVSLSFINSEETIQFNTLSTLNLLNAIKTASPDSKFYQASSSEMFGNVESLPINENTLLHPVSPYAISKASAHLTTINYRETYGLFACCGILFNHISVLSDDNFFVKKIINSAMNIKKGLQSELKLGNLDVKRDFGYAPDYVKAMWQMLQQEVPQDFIIASGTSICLRDLVYFVFDRFGLDRNKIIIDKNLFRPNEIYDIYGDTAKAKNILGWDYNKSIFDVLDLLIEEEMNNAIQDKCLV